MNKTLIIVNLIVILGLLLSACGASVGIQLPSLGGGSDQGDGQSAQNTTLFFVLIGAVVLIAVIALLSKK